MNFFCKKRIWMKVIKSDTNDPDYNQEMIRIFYKKVYESKGRIISFQAIPDIYSELIFPHEKSDIPDGEAFISSCPVFYISYSSKKEIYFNEDSFRNFYDRDLESRVGDVKSESLGKPTEN